MVCVWDEIFTTKGSKIVEANFLEIYGKFMNVDEKTLPEFLEEETLIPS